MGATHLAIILTNLCAQVIDEVDVPYLMNRGPEVCLPEVDYHLQGLLTKNSLNLTDINAIGVMSLDRSCGGWNSPRSAIMPGWDRYPHSRNAGKSWNRPVALTMMLKQAHLANGHLGPAVVSAILPTSRWNRYRCRSLTRRKNLSRRNGFSRRNRSSHDDRKRPTLQLRQQRLPGGAGGRTGDRPQAHEAVEHGERTVLSSMGRLEKLTARMSPPLPSVGTWFAQRIVSEAGSHLGIALAVWSICLIPAWWLSVEELPNR